MGNATSGYGPAGTGFATGTSAAPTKIAAVSSLATAVAPVSDSSACAAGSQSTTTIYSTDLVTMTVTAEDTTTVASSYAPHSNATVTSATETKTPSAVSSFGATSSNMSGVNATGMTASKTSTTAPHVSTDALVSSDATSATSAPPAKTTDSPLVSSADSYASSTMKAPSAAPSSSAATASSSAAPVSFSAISTGSYGTGKRGLAYNSAALTNAFAGKSMAWAYNWAANPSGTLGSGIEYVPMLWGQTSFGGWDAAAKSALANGAKHMLSFNEPDLSAQANMDSKTAADAHIKYMNPYASQAKIGSPAITNGGPSGGTDGMGLGWMQNFFDKCAGNCQVDFLAFHWYDSANNVAYFKNYVQSVIDVAKKHGVSKVWLTEFGASGSDAEVAKFLGEVLPWMDGNDAVERYAYFMCSDGKLVSGSAISDLVGKAYAA